ncbi:MAG TPA: hypothetical protein VNL77_11540, partial [Roseiflexaceae bacterium]|nr:hypothetical protein [Roseiflexaceae bacterium]
MAKSAAPLPLAPALSLPAIGQAEAGVTLIAAPPAYLLPERLAAALVVRGRAVIWLRLGPEDEDPACLLLSLIGAA